MSNKLKFFILSVVLGIGFQECYAKNDVLNRVNQSTILVVEEDGRGVRFPYNNQTRYADIMELIAHDLGLKIENIVVEDKDGNQLNGNDFVNQHVGNDATVYVRVID